MYRSYKNRMRASDTEAGFSLIELLIVILLLSVIMGSIFSQLDLVQKRFRSEQSKMDIVQTAREFMDQIIRDVHQTGFPNIRMYEAGVLGTSANCTFNCDSKYNAVGLVKITPTEVYFEGDVAGDGNVYAMAYKLFPASTNPGDENCPCLRRSQVQKADGVLPSSQVPDWRTQVENLSTTNPTIFSAYDKDGVLVPLGTGITRTSFNPIDTSDPINTIYTLQIQMNVQGASTDIGSSQRPQVFLTATAQINN